MSMNTPQEPIQQVDTSTLEGTAPVEPQMTNVVDNGVTPQEQPPVQEQPPAQEQQQQEVAQDEQVIEAVAEGLADEEISAADIMTAVLSDSLGISPAGAQQLFQLLMSELVDDVQEVQAPTQQEPPAEPPVM